MKEALRGGASHLATGHYASITHNGHGQCQLAMAADAKKDQTYFLSGLHHSLLETTLFPVGGLLKTQVKAIARETGMAAVASKKESMGICFIGKRNFASFLKDYIAPRPGDTVTVDGNFVSRHDGIHLYTIGQGLRLQSQPVRLRVVGKHVLSNTLVVDTDDGCRGSLQSRVFLVGCLRWTGGPPAALHHQLGYECGVRVRHRGQVTGAVVQHVGPLREARDGQQVACESVSHAISPPALLAPPLPCIGYVPAHVTEMTSMWESLRATGDCVQVTTSHALEAVAPGQVAALYRDGVCVGNGVIMAVTPLSASL